MQVQHQTQLIQTSSFVQTTVLCLTFELSDEHQSKLGQRSIKIKRIPDNAIIPMQTRTHIKAK